MADFTRIFLKDAMGQTAEPPPDQWRWQTSCPGAFKSLGEIGDALAKTKRGDFDDPDGFGMTSEWAACRRTYTVGETGPENGQ